MDGERLNHSQENDSAVGLCCPRNTAMSMMTANSASPPYWTMVRVSVVREDSSAPLATSQVVSRMNAEATITSNHTGELSMPAHTAAALVRMPAAPTPARMLDRIRA